MPTQRERDRAAKLAKKPTKSAFAKDDEDLARQKARDARDAKVNNEKTRVDGKPPEGAVFRDYRGTEGVVEDAQRKRKKK